MPSTPSPGPAAALDLAEALVREAVRSGADAADVMTYRTAALSDDGLVMVVPGAGHGIHLDRPAVVLDVIGDVVARVRARDH